MKLLKYSDCKAFVDLTTANVCSRTLASTRRWLAETQPQRLRETPTVARTAAIDVLWPMTPLTAATRHVDAFSAVEGSFFFVFCNI